MIIPVVPVNIWLKNMAIAKILCMRIMCKGGRKLMITEYLISYLATNKGFVKKIILDDVLNSHNDSPVIYVTFIPEKSKYRISDDCNTLFDINPDLGELSEEINEILKKYRLGFYNDEIFTYATKDELESREKEFAKALMIINQL